MKFDKEIKKITEFKIALQKYIDYSDHPNNYTSDTIHIDFSENTIDEQSLKKRLNTLLGEIGNYDVPRSHNEIHEYSLVFSNLFREPLFDLRHHINHLEQVIAHYQYHQNEFKRKRLNPIYWIGEFIRIPFHIISLAGFDINKIEFSMFGKVWKLIIYSIFFLAALATILGTLILTLEHCDIHISDIF